MARVITFSRYFPAHHPKKGQPTFFIEKVCKSIDALQSSVIHIVDSKVYSECVPKHHTIRAGNRWKVGDYFSPRVWSGKPYASKMIQIAPDIKIEKVWDITITKDFKDTLPRFDIFNKPLNIQEQTILAKNDGLTLEELRQWFNKVGSDNCQIICWNKNIEY